MCIFSLPVYHVGATKIFARGLDDGRQALVYAMTVGVSQELAMVLPLPVPVGAPEDAVSFVDLSGYPTFFDDLASVYLPIEAEPMMGFGAPPLGGMPQLRVHDVGDFHASFVPTRYDFARLDPRFRLPDVIWDAIPHVADQGFAVFKLKPRVDGRDALQTIHPMALLFPRRDPRTLYFPTIHLHDGHVPRFADFDHTLYCQPSDRLTRVLGWSPSIAPLGHRIDTERARGLIDPERYGAQLGISGTLENTDVELTEPDLDPTELRVRGRSFEASLSIRHGFSAPQPRYAATLRAWRETSRTKHAQLCRGIRAGLLELEQNRGSELGLGEVDWTLPAYFANESEIWDERRYEWVPPPKEGGGPGRLDFRLSTDLVEPQVISLFFRSLPGPKGLATIAAELTRIFDRAVA